MTVEGNVVRQLLVPRGTLEVDDKSDELWIAGSCGRWPATRTTNVPRHGPLTARLPLLRTEHVRTTWLGSRHPMEPSEVRDSYVGAFAFRAPGEPGSLRRPQIGA